MHRSWPYALTAVVFILACQFAAAQLDRALAAGVADFYKGNTISLYVSSAVGGGYDVYGRFLARQFGSFIPGNPTVIVRNMPGAGGAVAGNYLDLNAPHDGTALALLQNTLTIDRLGNLSSVKFDMRRFNWIGSMNILNTVCIFTEAAPVHSAADLLTKEVKVGAAGGASASPVLLSSMLNRIVGTKLRIIKGYEGTGEVLLAMSRGEVEGTCGVGWDSLQVTAAAMLASKQARIGLDIGSIPDAELRAQGVPFAMDLLSEGEAKDALRLILSPQSYGRPIAAPQNVPADRVAALRSAFDRLMHDPAVADEAKRIGLQLHYVSAEDVSRAIEAAFATPESVKKRAMEELRKAGWGGL